MGWVLSLPPLGHRMFIPTRPCSFARSVLLRYGCGRCCDARARKPNKIKSVAVLRLLREGGVTRSPPLAAPLAKPDHSISAAFDSVSLHFIGSVSEIDSPYSYLVDEFWIISSFRQNATSP